MSGLHTTRENQGGLLLQSKFAECSSGSKIPKVAINVIKNSTSKIPLGVVYNSIAMASGVCIDSHSAFRLGCIILLIDYLPILTFLPLLLLHL